MSEISRLKDVPKTPGDTGNQFAPETLNKPRYLHIVYTAPQEPDSDISKHISVTMLIYAEEGQVADLIRTLAEQGVANQVNGSELGEAIYITSSDRGLHPTGSVTIQEFINQKRIAADLAHASQIVNAAVNVACRGMMSAIQEGEMDSQLFYTAKQFVSGMIGGPESTSPRIKNKLIEIFRLAYLEANSLLKDRPGEVLANFDEYTRQHIEAHLGASSLWSYVSKVGIGVKSFTNANSPSSLLDENKDQVAAVVGQIILKAQQTPEQFLEVFLNTPASDLHALLQKAARGPNGSIGSDGNGLGTRLHVGFKDTLDGQAFIYQLDPAAQQEITELIQDHNHSIDRIIEIVRGSIVKYCDDNKIRLEVVPSHYVRYQGLCPVLGKAWTADDNPAISSDDPATSSDDPAASAMQTSLGGDQSHAHSNRHFHHPGYERPQKAYMGQVELVYAVLGRLKQLIDEQFQYHQDSNAMPGTD